MWQRASGEDMERPIEQTGTYKDTISNHLQGEFPVAKLPDTRISIQRSGAFVTVTTSPLATASRCAKRCS